MGRGGAKLGKPLKGRNPVVQSEKKEAGSAMPSNVNFDQIKGVWDRQAGRLKEIISREEANARVNQRLVTTLMRTQMRKEKLADLKDEVSIIAQEHQREMDRKDTVVQTMLGRLTEVEDQFLVLQRSHTQKLGVLNMMHKTKIRQLEAEFERDLKILKNEFNEERIYVETSHERMKKELKAIITAVESKNTQNIENKRTTHEFMREEIKNKSDEQINELRINLENKIDDLEKQFDDAHDAYMSKTKDNNKEFKKLQERDREFTQDNKRMKRKINKLQRDLRNKKNDIEMNRKECTGRNKILKEQRDMIAQHCRDLKKRMAKFREMEKKRLIELTVKSRKALKKNEGNVSQAERILKLMEAARKMETEREKVLPFYDSTLVDAKERELASKQGEEFFADMKSAGLKNVAKSKDMVEWNALENFHKKYNKVLLDKLAIEQEKLRLQSENQELRGVLQKYLDGIAVTADAVDGPNSLLIINGRTDRPMAKVKRVGKPVSVEATQIVAGYAKQAGRRSRA
uniref:Dynein regulatory complex subunit 2 n=1 Tax=Lotharella globosa TaxID=91324 RepID=A0A7S4E037_9EUKA|mmetsp:Transcript_16351/g.33171  ORF Transcript_16351/g.33171 Transcript_16351/m.33171 type:complete len:516 (+) Transcript_16351:49-1596(+)